MPNRHSGTLNKKTKYGIHYNDENYFSVKNKKYYEDSKSSLLCYYKKKYGKNIVELMINTYGLTDGLLKLKSRKSKTNELSLTIH